MTSIFIKQPPNCGVIIITANSRQKSAKSRQPPDRGENIVSAVEKFIKLHENWGIAVIR
jgi:hypothetical protein